MQILQGGLISILIIVLGAQIFLRSFLAKHIKKIFWGGVGLIVAYNGYISWLQYTIWKNNPTTANLLPPHQSIMYFLSYVGIHFWLPYGVSLLAAVIFISVFTFVNRAYEERFLFAEEVWIGGMALFLVGYPDVIVYVPLFLVAFVGVSLSRMLFLKKAARTSPYFLWIPVAVCVILASIWYLSALPWWNLLII